jgi:hypothetical protein
VQGERHHTAHLLYANAQGQTFSVFELTADAVYGAPSGAKYTQTAGGHVVSGLVTEQGCIAWSDQTGAQAMTKAQVEQLRDQLAATLPKWAAAGSSDTVARL